MYNMPYVSSGRTARRWRGAVHLLLDVGNVMVWCAGGGQAWHILYSVVIESESIILMMNKKKIKGAPQVLWFERY